MVTSRSDMPLSFWGEVHHHQGRLLLARSSLRLLRPFLEYSTMEWISPWRQYIHYISLYIGMIMVALTLLGFHGDFLVATTWWIFWCVNWPWYTTRVFWWFFRGNNPWHLDIEMIMVALRLHGLEAGTEPERSGSGAGTKRIRWFQRFFTVFHGFLACRFAPASLPLRSHFAPAFFFSCFLTFFAVFPVFFILDFWIFFDFLMFLCFFPGIVPFFCKG